jgi:hypothetical protein
MRIKLYRQNGALGSNVVFDALEQGLTRLGHTIVSENEDIPVIWSVLWHGRMQPNREIYNFFKKQNKPVMILEVGSLKRGTTWKVSLENINGQGQFNQTSSIIANREKLIGISLEDFQENRKSSILLLGQHDRSLQWDGLPPINQWLIQKISEIRKFSDRTIVVRPHPRCRISNFSIPNVIIESTNPLPNTYSEFDINFSHHCVINHNSGTTVQAAINGVPVICDQTALAYPVSFQLKDIETPYLPDRSEWFNQILHTEWLLEEISRGIPQERLLLSV